jgi:hypothetical protein
MVGIQGPRSDRVRAGHLDRRRQELGREWHGRDLIALVRATSTTRLNGSRPSPAQRTHRTPEDWPRACCNTQHTSRSQLRGRPLAAREPPAASRPIRSKLWAGIPHVGARGAEKPW